MKRQVAENAHKDNSKERLACCNTEENNMDSKVRATERHFVCVKLCLLRDGKPC